MDTWIWIGEYLLKRKREKSGLTTKFFIHILVLDKDLCCVNRFKFCIKYKVVYLDTRFKNFNIYSVFKKFKCSVVFHASHRLATTGRACKQYV